MSKKKNTNLISQVAERSVGLINLALLCGAALLFLAYIFYVNGVIAGKFRIGLLEKDLAALREDNSRLTAEKIIAADTRALEEFAVRKLMVKANRADYLFENDNVALRP